MNGPTQGVLGDIMVCERPDTPSAEQKEGLLISRSAIDSSERPTAVVGQGLSGKSRLKLPRHPYGRAYGWYIIQGAGHWEMIMKWVGGAPMSTASKVFVGLFVSLFFLCFAAKWMQSLQVAALLILPAGIVMVVSGWLDGRRYRRRLTQRLEAFRARHEVLEGRSDVVREREKPQGRYERYVKMSEFLLFYWFW